MATQSELGREKNFVCSILPWLAAAAGLLLYVLTLNHWISFNSLSYVARATGKMWMPEMTAAYPGVGPFSPALFVATYPLRFLPEKWVPLGLNLFSAVCGALTLALLARSVALLPHDRTHEQRRRERGAFAVLSHHKAWIPPVLAVVVCGLQLSFWEHATSMSFEVFETLLLAYVIRCLLEYRIDRRDSWMFRAGLVYGAAMTGNWLMIGLFPVFLASIVYIRGISSCHLGFLWRLLLCGLAGLLLFLLFPMICLFSNKGDFGFWLALKLGALAQKDSVQFYFLKLPRFMQLLAASTSLLPILLMSVRWASHFGDPSKVGIAVTTGILHIAHGALLGACIWVAFDPAFSPQRKGISIQELNYLGALSVGYFTGYFLLVFIPLLDRAGRGPGWMLLLHRLSQGVIWGLLVLVPLGLVSKNLPQVRMTNGPAVERFAASLTQTIPAHALILCDSQGRGDTPLKLWLAEAWLARNGKARDYVFADTVAMLSPLYQTLQHQRYGDGWPAVPIPKGSTQVPAIVHLRMIVKMAEQVPIYYLNTTFGYYIEVFYQNPRGLALEMKHYPTNALTRPPLTPAEISENEKFWQTNQTTLGELLPWIKNNNTGRKPAGFKARWMRALRIPFEPNTTALMLGRFYCQSITLWGVVLQKSGRWGEAGRYLDLALALNPDNLAAKASAECNKELRLSRRLSVPGIKTVQDEYAKYPNWERVLNDNGLFDDPLHCLIQGLAFTGGHLNRQAAQQFERVREFDPNYLPASLWLARFYATQFPDKSLALISQLHAGADTFDEFGIRQRDISMTEAMALYAAKKTPDADRILQEALDQNPRDEALLSMVVRISTMFGRLTNALSAVERELQIAPTNTAALLIQGYLLLQNSNYAAAIPPLTRTLSIEPNNSAARFNRAIACLLDDQLAQAQEDYLLLEKIFPNSFKVYYGLGEIAWRKKETNAAIRYYRLYLTNSVPESDESKLISDRLQSLTPHSP
jgi:tetratricopeptide (TPR) repeat protein